MAQQTYRANLSAAIYPMALSRSGRSVIIPQIDQNYDRRVDPTGEQKTPGIPQAIYLENVLPTAEGYTSVGYRNLQALPFTGDVAILEIDSSKTEARDILVFRLGSFDIWRWNGSSWQALTVLNTSDATTPNDSDKFSFAILHQFVLIFDGDNIWSYTSSIPSINRVDSITLPTGVFTPAGVLDDLVAITASSGYLIFFKDTGNQVSVLWSSLLSIFDFVPSLVTGAGGGALQEAQGRAVTCSPTPGGFYLYNTSNILESVYTGNARYPFKFRPVTSAEGIQSKRALHSTLTDSGPLYMNRFYSLTQIVGNKAAQQAPELTEFLERFYELDTFSYALNTFSKETVTLEAFDNTAPYLYGGRYVCVSVRVTEVMGGIQPYNYIYIYDTLLNRYGRLKVDHTHIVHAFESVNTDFLGVINARDGTFKRWNFDASVAGIGQYDPMQGVILLGKFQGIRSNRIGLEELEIESSLHTKGACSVFLLPSENGKTFLPAVAPHETAYSSTEVKSFLAHTDSRNISLLIKGAFDLTTVLLKFQLTGDD